jgi:hypothetical protein
MPKWSVFSFPLKDRTRSTRWSKNSLCGASGAEAFWGFPDAARDRRDEIAGPVFPLPDKN